MVAWRIIGLFILLFEGITVVVIDAIYVIYICVALVLDGFFVIFTDFIHRKLGYVIFIFAVYFFGGFFGSCSGFFSWDI